MEKLAKYKKGQEIRIKYREDKRMYNATIIDMYYNYGDKSYKDESWIYLIRFVSSNNQHGIRFKYMEVYEEKINKHNKY